MNWMAYLVYSLASRICGGSDNTAAVGGRNVARLAAAAAAVVDLLTNNSRRIAIGSAAAAFVRNNFDSTGRLAHTARLLR